MNMIPIIPSMPFLAFPSEKVLAEFQPVRGLLVTAPLPGGADNRPAADFQSLADLTDLHDPRPLIAAICQEMGYDPDLVAAGEGETGVPGHSWTSYCDETWLPMLVRWQAGEAQLILTFVETHGRDILPDLTLGILGDEAALPILRRLAVVLTPFHIGRPSSSEGQVQCGGRKRWLGIPEIPVSGFEIVVQVPGNAAGLIGPERAEELADIVRSCALSSCRYEVGDAVKPDELQLWWQSARRPMDLWSRPPAFELPAGRRLAPELVRLIQRQSVADIRRRLTHALGRHFDPGSGFLRPDSLFYGVEQQKPAVIAQRLHLAGILQEIEHAPNNHHGIFGRPFGTYHLARGETSISQAFRRPEDDVLEGTEHRAYGRDGATSFDLLTLGIQALELTLKHLHAGQVPAELREPPKQGVPVPEFAELRRAPGAPRARLMPAGQAGFGFIGGLPVRVDKSVVVWRSDDSKALAIDFAVTCAGTHLGGLRRVPIPVKVG
jgi:hypothetical protein